MVYLGIFSGIFLLKFALYWWHFRDSQILFRRYIHTIIFLGRPNITYLKKSQLREIIKISAKWSQKPWLNLTYSINKIMNWRFKYTFDIDNSVKSSRVYLLGGILRKKVRTGGEGDSWPNFAVYTPFRSAAKIPN